MKVPFSPPHIDSKILDEVTAALQSGWITTGPRVKLLEEKLRSYCHAGQVLCVNSCSSGLELALRWFGVGPGDEVILPAYTYAATANVIVHCGATPVFVDSGTDANIDPSAVRKVIGRKTKAIIGVDIGGWPCDYDELMQIAESRTDFSANNKIQQTLGRPMLLSDAAHSLGAEYKGRKTGTLADISVFSFHAVKNLSTSEGGAICLSLPTSFNLEAIYNEFRIKSLHGQTKDAMEKFKGGSWRYDIIEAGYKYNMPDVLAAIGLVEISRYENDILKKREHVFNKYNELLKDYSWAELPISENNSRKSSYHAYTLRIKNITEAVRDAIINDVLAKEVAVNVHFVPLPMMTFYKNLGYNINNYPVAFDLYSREISLPVFYDITDEQIELVIETLADAIEKNT